MVPALEGGITNGYEGKGTTPAWRSVMLVDSKKKQHLKVIESFMIGMSDGKKEGY